MAQVKTQEYLSSGCFCFVTDKFCAPGSSFVWSRKTLACFQYWCEGQPTCGRDGYLRFGTWRISFYEWEFEKPFKNSWKSAYSRMLRILHPGALCRFSLSFNGAPGLALLPPTSLSTTPLSTPLSTYTVCALNSCPLTPKKCSLPFHHPASTNLADTAAVIFPPNRPLSTSPLWRHGHDEDKVSSVRFIWRSHVCVFSGSWNYSNHFCSQRWYRGGCLG